MSSSTRTIWLTVSIIALLGYTILVTTLVLFVIRHRTPPSSTEFSCSSANPEINCPSITVTSGLPGGADGTGFLTGKQISPSIIPTQSLSPSPPLKGYYHAHPTAYYRLSGNPTGILYSYPFVLQVTSPPNISIAPSMNLSAYSFSTTPVETASSPFQQFSYPALGAPQGYIIDIPGAQGVNMPPFSVDFIAYPSSGTPTLASVLTSQEGAPGTRIVSLIMNQGSPFMSVWYRESSAGGAFMSPVLRIGNFGSYEESIFVVSTPPARTYKAYTFWNSSGAVPHRAIVWFCDMSIQQGFSVVSGVATLSLGLPSAGDLSALVYISMFSQVGPLMGQVMQLVANSLSPCFINLSDIIPSPQNTAVKYTITPIPSHTLFAGNSTLFILPPTCFEVTGLAGITLPGTKYLDFPLGNGIYQTNPQVGAAVNTFFYTLWPPPSPRISDFSSYTLQDASGVIDANASVNTDLDLYDLALALRILHFSPGSSPPTPVQINALAGSWQTKMQEMGVGNNTLFTSELGFQDAGLVSRISYLLTTYIQLNAIKGFLATSTSAYGFIQSAGPQVTMLVEGGLTTAPLGSQSSPSYTPLAFLDSYSCTIPVIKTVGLGFGALSLPQLTSRLGEVLSYLWACDNIVSNGLISTASMNIPGLCRSLYSIVQSATTRLLRGSCATSSLLNLAPVMPWTTLISQSQEGFQLDGATPGGSSPDSTLLQSFTPFTPATHTSLRSLFNQISVPVMKLIKCIQFIPQAPPSEYSFVGFVDPALVGYFLYLYSGNNYSGMIRSGHPAPDMTPFIKMITLQHPANALFMNQVKLGILSQPTVS